MVDMLGFWKSHADFVHFICGQAFILILPPCLSLHRQAVGPRLRWLLLAVFGLFFGLGGLRKQAGISHGHRHLVCQ